MKMLVLRDWPGHLDLQGGRPRGKKSCGTCSNLRAPSWGTTWWAWRTSSWSPSRRSRWRVTSCSPSRRFSLAIWTSSAVWVRRRNLKTCDNFRSRLTNRSYDYSHHPPWDTETKYVNLTFFFQSHHLLKTPCTVCRWRTLSARSSHLSSPHR